MPQVKLKIEVNGGSSGAGLNASADKSANNVGFASIPNSYDSSFKGTRLLRLDTAISGKSVHFNSQGYLASYGEQEAGQLQSEQNKRQFVYGSTDANGEYELSLTLTTDSGTFDKIVVVGDSISNQFPIEAIIDSTTTIYSDDPYWSIDLGDKQSSHTIKFTKWNKANYNACFNQIKLMLQYYEIDRFNGLKSVDSLSQSTPDASEIYYGTLANSGSAQIVDVDGEIEDMINDGILENSNVPVELYIDNHLVQAHITTDSDYTQDRILDLQFTNKIENWDKTIYSGYPYQDATATAYEMLYDVLSGLGSSQPVDDMLSEQIIYGSDNAVGTIKSYLQLITIPYPYLPSDTYRNTIDKFCRLAQLQVFQKDNGDIKFISARPISSGVPQSNLILVPEYSKIDPLNKTIMLKNNYDAVKMTATNFYIEKSKDVSLYTKKEEIESYSFDSGYYSYLSSDKKIMSRIDAYYTSGSFFIPETEDLGKIRYMAFSNRVDSSGDFYNYYLKRENTQVRELSLESYLSDTDTPLDFDSLKNLLEEVYVTPPQSQTVSDANFYISSKLYENIGGCVYLEGQLDPSSQERFFMKYDENSKQVSFITYYPSFGNATASFTDNSSITISKVLGGYNVSYNILSKIFVCGYIRKSSSPSDEAFLISENEVKNISITLYGDKRTLVIEDINLDDSTSSTKAIATVDGSEILQSGAKYNNSVVMTTLIKNNIKNDYAKGVSSANIRLFCLNYYFADNNIAKNFGNGEVIELNDFLSINNDNKIWKVTGRQLSYAGQSTLELQLTEVKIIEL